MKQDLPEEVMAFFEKDIKWSIDSFFQFNFPDKENTY
jgi:hypothetical protein